MSTDQRSEGGLPRVRRAVATRPGGRAPEENWAGANDAKVEKLRGRSLRRQAGGQGLELRHSAYGYALVDSERKHVDGRSEMNLDEVEACLRART